MCFDNEMNTTYKYSPACLSKLRSTGIPAIWNNLLGTDFSQNTCHPFNPETLLSNADSEI